MLCVCVVDGVVLLGAQLDAICVWFFKTYFLTMLQLFWDASVGCLICKLQIPNALFAVVPVSGELIFKYVVSSFSSCLLDDLGGIHCPMLCRKDVDHVCQTCMCLAVTHFLLF